MDRLGRRKVDLDDAYAQPANFLEIEVHDPITQGGGNLRFTEYTITTKTNLPVFTKREASVRRRYSDFEWLRSELQRDVKIVVPPMPGKSLRGILGAKNSKKNFETFFLKFFRHPSPTAPNALPRRRRHLRTRIYRKPPTRLRTVHQ